MSSIELGAGIFLLFGAMALVFLTRRNRKKQGETDKAVAGALSVLRQKLKEEPHSEEAYEAILAILGEAVLTHKDSPFQGQYMRDFMGHVEKMKEQVPYSQKPDLLRVKLLYELKASALGDEKALFGANVLFERQILTYPYTLSPFIYWANAVGGDASFSKRTLVDQVKKWELINAILENALVYSHANPAFVRSKWVDVYLGVMKNKHAKEPIRIAAAILVARQVVYCLDNLEAWLLSHGLTMGQADQELKALYMAFFTALEEVPYPFAVPLLTEYERVVQKLTFISEDSTAACSLDLVRLFRALESEEEQVLLDGIEAFDRVEKRVKENVASALCCESLLGRGYLFKARFAANEAQKRECLASAVSAVIYSKNNIDDLRYHALNTYVLARMQMMDPSREPQRIVSYLVRQVQNKHGWQYDNIPPEYLRNRADYFEFLLGQGGCAISEKTLRTLAEKCRQETQRRKRCPEFVDGLHPSKASRLLVEGLLFSESEPFGPLFPSLASLASN